MPTSTVPIRNLRLLLAILIAAVTTAQPRGAASDVLPFKAAERTLPNGLKVIVVPTGFPNLVTIDIPVQTGSRNEVEPGKSGFAHFFEHLMFRGTPDNPPEKYREIMSKAGARDNASTSDDYTHYYATFAKEHLERYSPSTRTCSSTCRTQRRTSRPKPERFSASTTRTAPNRLGSCSRCSATNTTRCTPTSTRRWGLLPTSRTCRTITEYSKVFFDRWYRPQNTTLVIGGDVAPEMVMPLVEKLWGGWKPGSSSSVAIPKEPAPTGPKYVQVPWPSDTLPYVTVAFPAPAFVETSKDAPALDILAALYFGSTSELYKRLVVSEQKVDQLFVDVPSNVDPTLFTVFARIKNPTDAVYVRDQILATIASARTAMGPPERLADAKSFNRYVFARSLDSTERITSTVARFATYRRSVRDRERVLPNNGDGPGKRRERPRRQGPRRVPPISGRLRHSGRRRAGRIGGRSAPRARQGSWRGGSDPSRRRRAAACRDWSPRRAPAPRRAAGACPRFRRRRPSRAT